MLTDDVRAAVASNNEQHRIQRGRIERVFSLEWLGQTIASVCWIGSVLAYGISSSGDWLQLFAASAWLLANIASLMTIKAD